MRRRIDVGVLGATGMVGQQFVLQLAKHPWFRLAWLGASERSAGQRVRRRGALAAAGAAAARGCRACASRPRSRAMRPSSCSRPWTPSVAGEIEQAFAKAGHVVVSNSRNHRMDAGRAAAHPGGQRRPHRAPRAAARARAAGQAPSSPTRTARRCSSSMALAPLRAFGLKSVVVTTLQALSGAGYPGVASLDAVGERRAVHRRRGDEDRDARRRRFSARWPGTTSSRTRSR